MVLIVVGVFLSLVLFFVTKRMERLQVKQDIYQESRKIFQDVEDALYQNLGVLDTLKVFYLSSMVVTRDEFKTFAGHFLKKFNNIQALQWAPFVDSGQRSAYESEIRQEGFINFQITERDSQDRIISAANRTGYFPVHYVEPFESNKEVLGYDAASSDTRLQTVINSGRQGPAGDPLSVSRKKGNNTDFVIYVPVFKGEGTTRNEGHPAGYMVGIFNLDRTFEAIQRDLLAKKLTLRITDESADEKDNGPVYASVFEKGKVNTDKRYTATETLFFAGRTWTLIIEPTSEYLLSKNNQQPFMLLFCGFLVTLVIAINFNLKQIEKEHQGLVLVQNEELKYMTSVAEKARKDAVEYADRLEKSLKETQFAKAELERSNKELEEFAYVASHDLQEPLRMVSGFTQLLEKKYKDQLDDKAREYIHFANDGALRMQTLIEALLQYSRVGKKDTAFEEVDLNGVMAQVLADLDFSIKETHADIKVDPLPVLTVNRAQMVQLFQNLILNALKFREQDKAPVIAVACQKKTEHWQFSVKDNGIGIDPRFSDKIFVIFQRLHSNKKYPGTGIGLSLCKKIVENYKGRIWIESEPGKGSIFHFTIVQK
ncbi:MAG: CHASE domain-containing protein [Candidatus Omnitrophota bacterium]